MCVLCCYIVFNITRNSRENYFILLLNIFINSQQVCRVFLFFFLNGNRFYVLIVSKIGFIGITYILVFLRVVRGVHKIAIINTIIMRP